MGTLLHRLGALAARRHRLFLVVWLAAIGAVVTAGVTGAGAFESSGSLPGSPAQLAQERMEAHFPPPGGHTAQLVFRAAPGRALTEPGARDAVVRDLAAVAAVDGVAAVSDPLAEGGRLSADATVAVAEVALATPASATVPGATLDALGDATGAGEAVGVDVVLGGEVFEEEASALGPAEIAGVAVAAVILVITFGGLLAAGLPLLTAVAGLLISVTGLVGLASLFGISENAPTLAAMLGLAVGIDYALFVVSRHRAQLAAGVAPRESIALANATAGGAVFFAGATVVVALLGLSVAGVPMLTSMGVATAAAVAVAVLAALTLLPALLALAGDRLTPRPGSRAAGRATGGTAKPPLSVRWVRTVTRHPVRTVCAVLAVLGAVALPAAELRLALTDAGSEPSSAPSRVAYDLIADAFGPGANGPLVVLVESDAPGDAARAAEEVTRALDGSEGVAGVSGTQATQDGLAARIVVTPETGPRSAETGELVGDIRTVLERFDGRPGVTAAVTGLTAVSIDVSDRLSGAVLPFTIVVAGLSMLLLLVAFRSVAVPVKATVGFLLSVAAAFGATVAVFQWGWLAGPLGLAEVGPVASFTPIIVMAVLFGLAMDYEVFLVSAMREEYLVGAGAADAVERGARQAGRVVVAAALIMVAVFVGFFFSHDATIKAIAFALGVGVLADAFLVRLTLVPAVLALLGHRAWWLPRWLDRVLPRLDVEGGGHSRPGAASEHAGPAPLTPVG
ncbi:MMPL family transporter [Streptomyces avicenniae]|uniref:MMPL family transporter n=1 Tax=Streptomyces avicenniae TaxID=500153 RepID=UPI000699B116|nr:MMPL family transporter [Streptomyces avicenniae]